ncbi:hypothetical protein [Bacillus toyonensis]|uniref:hypothetical protein n=1 Tax=Bacillus toyonensis TaxID=155322 RepID=UPI000BFCB3AD|nr:hypothetical protein [Bacillus toyonensis]PHG54356.1 hypothetical protein COI57_01780 [Bacillus toyonensis]
MAIQRDWAFCEKCYGLFFNLYPDKGSCPGGRGGHKQAQTGMGYDYMLNHSIPSNQYTQPEWEYCKKCHGMFFNGYPNKGICPSGGVHERHKEGYHFVLKHDTPRLYSNEQPYWDFCIYCQGLFYNGFNKKGSCPASEKVRLLDGDYKHIGGHKRHPEAYNFILTFWTASPPPYPLIAHCGWPPNPSICPGYH